MTDESAQLRIEAPSLDSDACGNVQKRLTLDRDNAGRISRDQRLPEAGPRATG